MGKRSQIGCSGRLELFNYLINENQNRADFAFFPSCVDRPLLAEERPLSRRLRPLLTTPRFARPFECVIDLDSEVAHRTLQLGVAKEELDRPEILGPTIDK